MKKAIGILLAFAMMAGVLAGCSAPASQTGNNGGGANLEQGASLVYWPMWAETEPQGVVISEAIDAFTAETGVKVEVNWAGARDSRKTMVPALDANERIDVFDEDIERVNVTWSKYTMDIQALYDASPLKDTQNATLINLAKELGGGSMHSVPYQPSSFIMMYNKDCFDKAGIKAVPTNWDEFLAACESLKTAGIIPMTVDDAYMAALFGYLMDRVAGFETTKAVAAGDFTNPAVLETAKVLESLVQKGYIDPRAAGNAFPQGQSNIADESVAMYLDGTWLPNEIRNQTKEGFRWGSFALPQIAAGGDGAESNQYGSQCFAINKDCQYPNAAFALIQWLTSGTWDQKLADDTLGVPMSNNAVWPAPLTDAKAVIDATTQRLTWAVDMENDANVNATIKTAMSKMITGEMNAQGFADSFAAIQKAS